jgi:Putative transposase
LAAFADVLNSKRALKSEVEFMPYDILTHAFSNQAFQFKGRIAQLAKPQHFMKLKAQLSGKTWNVYAKEPFNGAEGSMEYLARYGISNERLLSCNEGLVTFKYRDSSDNNKTKIMKLAATEFIRRYVSHTLPHGFMRARYFGFLANPVKTKNITLIHSLLSAEKQHNITQRIVQD